MCPRKRLHSPNKVAYDSIRPLEEIMRCPACGSALEREANGFRCTGCDRAYRVSKDDLIDMVDTR